MDQFWNLKKKSFHYAPRLMGFFALLCEIQALKVLTKVKGGLGVTYDILVKALRLKMDFLFLEFRNLGLGLSIFRFFGMTIE